MKAITPKTENLLRSHYSQHLFLFFLCFVETIKIFSMRSHYNIYLLSQNLEFLLNIRYFRQGFHIKLDN